MSLADVLPSCLASVQGDAGALGLAPVSGAVVLVVDGMGAAALKARAGHARRLASLLDSRSIVDAGFPTTTAASLATLTTGVRPGTHGMVGYTVVDPVHDRVVNQLSGWDEKMDPLTWQRSPTVFERAAERGVGGHVVAEERFRHSGFTEAVLRGAEFHGAGTLSRRLEEARRILDDAAHSIVYVYTSELDKIGHSHGWQSARWTAELEDVDRAVSEFAATLRKDEGLLVTADHGVLDVRARDHIFFDREPRLLDGIRFVAGEPRCLQLHFEPDASPEHRATVLDRWRASEGARSWVVDRKEAIAADWFGAVAEPVAPRIGDILVAARKRVAYYDSRGVTANSGRSMVGQHGSWSPEETRVPLVRLGAWAF